MIHETITFFNTSEVSLMLSTPSNELEDLESVKALLAMHIPGEELQFPVFQFRDNDFWPEAISVFQSFSDDYSSWEVASWFYSWNENLHDYPKRLLELEEYSKLKLTIAVESTLRTL